MQEAQLSNKWRKILLLFNCIFLFIGKCGGPLIMRLYFIRGGKRIWFSSLLETAGWPVTLIPLTISYFLRRRNENTTLILIRHRLFIASAVIGLLTGLDDYLYAYGVAGLPVSTSSLVISSQLAFTALFAFLIVKQKFTAYSINAVVLLTMGSGVLAMNTKGDRPEGESSKMYVLGFMLTLAAAVLYGAVLPMVELMYAKGKQKINFTLLMEIQTVISIFATGFCAVGMLLNGEFKDISSEARDYELGETKYYMVVTLGAILMQCFFLGAIGVIFCASSLFCGIISACLLPVTEFLAVIFYGEKFGAEKGVALALSIWGFISYFYGEINQRKNGDQIQSDSDQCIVEEKEVTERVVP